MVVELPHSGHRKSFACESFTVRPMARCPMLHLAALAARLRQRATYQRRD
jgi:hypothetical protein